MSQNERLKRIIIISSITIVLLTVFITITTILAVEEKDCVIDIRKDFVFEHPLVLKPGGNELLSPDENGKLLIKSGETISLFCTGDENYFIFGKNEKEKTIQCIKKDFFKSISDDAFGNFKDFRCNVYPKSIARETENKCGLKNVEIEIGFDIPTGFVSLMKTCFNNETKDSFYSTFVLSGNIKRAQITNKNEIDFQDDGFYAMDKVEGPKLLYSRINQKFSLFKKFIKTSPATSVPKDEDIDKFINSNYLNRGHLTAKADYIYNSQQMATYHYVNAAPQWQEFNSGNWNSLEQDIRNFVGSRRQDYVIYTGVYGTLRVKYGNYYVPFYLNSGDANVLAVPDVFWKILYDPRTFTAVAFIGHNDPFNNDIRPMCTTICDEIADKIQLSWDAMNYKKGYSYCCSYKELTEKIAYLPVLNVTGIIN